MGEIIEIGAVAVVVAFLIPIAWRLGELVFYQFIETKVTAMAIEREFRPKKKAPVTWTGDIAAGNLTPPPKKAQDLPKPPLNSYAARKVMEGANREYFSAERKKTNSEILKEQE